MTVSEEKLNRAIGVLRSFGARRILMFGSCVHNPETARDIDLAVEGIPLKSIWRADGEVAEILEVPHDLVFREENPGFYEMIEKRAIVLYEQKDTI